MADEEKEEKGSKKGMSVFFKGFIVFFMVVILGAGGFAGWKYYELNRSGSKKAASKQIVEEPGLWSMDSQIVNLMDNNGERYLKATIQIEVSNQESIAELDLLKPKILDSILGLLSSKSYREIAGFEGKQRLKDEVAVRLNGFLTKGQARRVYFTEFLIQ
jgi:flagellar protein FliL